MRYKEVGATLGNLLMMFSATFALPIFVGAYYSESPLFLYKAYMIPALATASVGCIMWYNSRNKIRNLKEGDAYIVVGLGWIVVALFGALPYMTGSIISNPLDAYFESMSGFTTTGASILDPSVGDYFVRYPRSILFWRSLTHWLGGMGIIVMGVVVLARFMHGGIYLFKAEVAGSSVTRLRPKLHQTARILWAVYGLLTLACTLMLVAAGMPGFDAVCTSMSTLSTGGFSVRSASIGHYSSIAIETVVIVFMLAGAINFVLHFKIMSGKFKEAFSDPEMQYFLAWVCFMASMVIMGLAISRTMGAPQMLRHGIFQTVTTATGTGFSNADNLGLWPPFVILVLVMLMLTGACLGSTSGGLKISRVMVLFKNLRNGMVKAVHPRAILSVKMGDRAIPEKVVARIQILFLIFITVFGLSVLLLCASGIGIVDSITAVASCLANCGLGVFGPDFGFHVMNPFAKAVLIVCMWMGRLEIFTALIVLAPSTYKR